MKKLMMKIENEITQLLLRNGADLIGFADINSLPSEIRKQMPRAVSFAVALDPLIISSIENGPTKEYYTEYVRVNNLLSKLSESVAQFLKDQGYNAINSAATDEGIDPETYSTILPHKTIATMAGLGWIGKCALLINKDFGSAIRLNRVLTDAPFNTVTSINESNCGICRECVDRCPGTAATGDNWNSNKFRDEFFDAHACRKAAREIANQNTGIQDTFCGICIASCPWTKEYIKRSTKKHANHRLEPDEC